MDVSYGFPVLDLLLRNLPAVLNAAVNLAAAAGVEQRQIGAGCVTNDTRGGDVGLVG
jgi:hypothetical protein